MKILFVTPEFEEQARGITGIVKALIRAAKADGHEVGMLAGYPNTTLKHNEFLDKKVEHINLQHYLISGKRDLFPKNIRSNRTLLKILSGRQYLTYNWFPVDQKLITDRKNIANWLDFVIKIPYSYHFINHGFPSVPKSVLKRAIKKLDVDIVITGSPMSLTHKDVGSAKLIQFVHDTMPLDLLETPADNNTPYRFAQQLHDAAVESDLVMTNSQDTNNKVLEINPSATTQIMYGTASAVPDDSPETAILKTLGLEKDKYLMYLSVIEKRKNVSGLMEAYSLIHDKLDMPLVVAGAEGFGSKDIHKQHQALAPEIRDKIIFTGFISENDKYMLLKNARTFTFPSFYEGIGLQIIEALSSNTPVVTTRAGALPEAAGENAYYINDPYDVSEIADAIYTVSTDESVRKKLLKEASSHLANFTVEKFNERFKEGIAKITN